MLITFCLPAFANGALFTAAAALLEGDAETLFSVYPSTAPAEGFPDDPAYLAQVTPPDGEAYTFLFPSYEGSEAGLAPLLRFADINGDGYQDVEALFAMGASNLSCTYYLYNPADGRLHYSEELGILANAFFDAEHNIILSQISDGAATKYYTLYTVENGIPALARTALMDAVIDDDAYTLHTQVLSVRTGTALLDESIPFQDDEAAVWNAQYEHLIQVLIHGF